MNLLRIRRANEDDLDTLIRQRHMMFEEMRHRPAREHNAHDHAFKKWALNEMRAKRLFCFVVANAERKGVAGGSIWLREVQPYPGFNGGKVPYLMSMYTEPEFRRRGLGTMVTKNAIEWARENGYRSITLHASRMGRTVYEKMGFENSNEMEYEIRDEPKSSARAPRRSDH